MELKPDIGQPGHSDERRFNRTSVELKRKTFDRKEVESWSFNRTSVELKQRTLRRWFQAGKML